MGTECKLSVQAFRMLPGIQNGALLVHDGTDPITVIALRLSDENMVALMESESIQKNIGAAIMEKVQALLLRESLGTGKGGEDGEPSSQTP